MAKQQYVKFYLYAYPDEERTYWICEDCEPYEHDHELCEELTDTYGEYVCERCGLYYDHDIEEYRYHE